MQQSRSSDLGGQRLFVPGDGPLYRPMALCLAALLFASGVFLLNPGLDLATSRLFYEPGKGFAFGQTAPIVSIRNAGIATTWVVCIGLAVLALVWLLSPAALARWPSPRPWIDWLFVTAAMALGPGTLVNLIIKPIWGRARPRQIIEFGGTRDFSPAWVVTNQCSWGCSFVSGEAAASAFLFVFAFVVPTRWRPLAFWAALAVTIIISFVRIAAGGHFLSDTVIASLLMVLLLLVLHAQLYHGALLGPLKRWSPLR